jgi:hypothetical protein
MLWKLFKRNKCMFRYRYYFKNEGKGECISFNNCLCLTNYYGENCQSYNNNLFLLFLLAIPIPILIVIFVILLLITIVFFFFLFVFILKKVSSKSGLEYYDVNELKDIGF